jgi:DNA-binding CsgD family transcriptional regulator
MDGLSRRDLQSAFEFLDGAYRCADVDALSRHVTTRLLQLIPSDRTAYNEIDPDHRRVRWVYDGLPPVANAEQVFTAYMHEHPCLAHFARPEAGAAVKISDFLGPRDWRRRGLYNEFYRPMGSEHVIAITIPILPPLILEVAAIRGGRDFSERDRRVLDLIRPHLVHAYESAVGATSHAAELALLSQGIDAAGAAAIVLSSDGRIKIATNQARRLLAAYFQERGAGAERLPDSIVTWLAAGEMPAAASHRLPPMRRPLIVERDRARLVMQLLGRGRSRVLLLREERTASLPEDLAALSLTRREAEILEWVARGKTDADVAVILTIARRTVSHTLERIYRKLGVHNRAGAVARARMALGRDQD